MIPILYNNSTSIFDGANTPNPIGYLADTMSCTVTEEINGEYALTLRVRYDGLHASAIDLYEGQYILSAHDDSGDIQPFRVEKITKNLDGTIEVYAPHLLSAWLKRITVFPFTAPTPEVAMAQILNKVMTTDYTAYMAFTTNITLTTPVVYNSKKPRTIRGLLAGEEGSLVDAYGRGELLFNNWSTSLLEARGEDRGLTVRYGKNLSKFKAEYSSTRGYNAIVPFWYDPTAGKRVMAATGNTYSDYIVSDGHPYEYALPVDITSNITLGANETEPTTAQVAAAGAAWLTSNKPQNTDPTISIGLATEWQLGDRRAPYVPIRLGDALTVVDPRYRINSKYRVQKLTYDVLRERYTSVEVGKLSPSLYKTIRNIAKS